MDINKIYEAANIVDIIHDPTAPRLVINKDKVVNSNTVDGLEVYTKEIENGVSVELIVRKGKIITKPVHLCFGITDEQAVQYIIINAKTKMNRFCYNFSFSNYKLYTYPVFYFFCINL